MSRNILQSWTKPGVPKTPKKPSVFQKVKSSISDIIGSDSVDDGKKIISLINSWKFSKASRESTDIFMRKMTEAKDEWCFYVQDFKDKDYLKSLYEWENTSFWTNGGNFGHYRFETTFQSRKLSIFFYHSADYHGEKVSFDELLEKNEPIRVCLY